MEIFIIYLANSQSLYWVFSLFHCFKVVEYMKIVVNFKSVHLLTYSVLSTENFGYAHHYCNRISQWSKGNFINFPMTIRGKLK